MVANCEFVLYQREKVAARQSVREILQMLSSVELVKATLAEPP